MHGTLQAQLCWYICLCKARHVEDSKLYVGVKGLTLCDEAGLGLVWDEEMEELPACRVRPTVYYYCRHRVFTVEDEQAAFPPPPFISKRNNNGHIDAAKFEKHP